MATLIQLASEICAVVGKESDHLTIERIKDSIKHVSAELIRREIERNGVSQEYVQHINATLIKVDEHNIGCNETDTTNAICLISRTAYKIPNPVNFKNPEPFIYVGDLVGHAFSYNQNNDRLLLDSLFLLRGIASYQYINGYIYIKNYDGSKIRISHRFADPEQAAEFCTNTCYTDDMEFPISEHLIPSLKRIILADEFKMVLPDNDIKINEEPQPQRTK